MLRIKVFREAKGLSQRALGEMVGVSQTSICEYETGRKYPRMRTLNQLADVLDTDIDTLLGRKSV